MDFYANLVCHLSFNDLFSDVTMLIVFLINFLYILIYALSYCYNKLTEVLFFLTEQLKTFVLVKHSVVLIYNRGRQAVGARGPN